MRQRHFLDGCLVLQEPGDVRTVTSQDKKASAGQTGRLNRISAPGQKAEWQTVIERVWDSHRIRPFPRGWMSPPPDPEAAATMDAIVNLHRGTAPDDVVYYLDEKLVSGVLAGGRGTARNSGRWRHRMGVLFAALDPVGGRVIARCMRRQRSREFIRFLDVLNRETPTRHQVHIILDNFAPHKRATVQEWLSRHSRFKLHFSPVGMSWTNLVELFFSDLVRRRLKWSTYSSVSELRAALANFIASADVEPRFQIFGHPRTGSQHVMNIASRV